MPVVKLHKTVGVRVGTVQVGGGAPVVVQSMTMTDTADAAATAAQCIELAEAGSEMVRVTVNLPEAAAAVPEIKQRMLDAGVTRAAHRRLPLQRPPAADAVSRTARARSTSTASIPATSAPASGATSSSRRSARWRATTASRCASASTAARSTRSSSSRRCRRTPTAISARRSEEIINECMVLSAVESTELALETGLRKDQIIISCKTSRPRDLIAVYRELARQTDQPLHLGLTEAGMGIEGAGLVGVGDGRAAERRDRRHDPRLADAAAGRRSARRGLRRVRAAAGARPAIVLAERHRLSRAAAARRARTFQELAERMQDYIRERMPEWKTQLRGRRDDDARRDGLRRQRPRRIEGGEHRHQPAGHRRGAELPGLHRRPALHDAARHLRRARRRVPRARRQLRRDEVPAESPTDRCAQSIRLTSVAPFSYSFRRCSPSTSSNAGVPLASEPRPSARSDISVRSRSSRPPTSVRRRVALTLSGVLFLRHRGVVGTRDSDQPCRDASCLRRTASRMPRQSASTMRQAARRRR